MSTLIQFGIASLIGNDPLSTAKRLRRKAQGCFNPGYRNFCGQPGTGCDRRRSRVAVEPLELL